MGEIWSCSVLLSHELCITEKQQNPSLPWRTFSPFLPFSEEGSKKMRWERVEVVHGSVCGGPGKRWAHTCNATKEGRFLYVFGGFGQDNRRTNLVHVFDSCGWPLLHRWIMLIVSLPFFFVTFIGVRIVFDDIGALGVVCKLFRWLAGGSSILSMVLACFGVVLCPAENNVNALNVLLCWVVTIINLIWRCVYACWNKCTCLYVDMNSLHSQSSLLNFSKTCWWLSFTVNWLFLL